MIELFSGFDQTQLITMDGFDDCIAGIVEQFGKPPIVCYDKEKVISKMVNNDGVSVDEAEEYWAFNQVGAWVGENTPCFITKIKEKVA